MLGIDTFSPVDLLDNMYLSFFVHICLIASPFRLPSCSERLHPCQKAKSPSIHFQIACLSITTVQKGAFFVVVCCLSHLMPGTGVLWVVVEKKMGSAISKETVEDVEQVHSHDDAELAHGLQVLHCSSKLFF